MPLLDHSPEVFHLDSGVDGSGGNRLVPEKLLDVPQLRSLLQQMGRKGVPQRGSIALLERLWRTLKAILCVKAFPPLVEHELEYRLELALLFYAFFRPHQGLGGATPAEIYYRHVPAHLSGVPPPRGRPREGPSDAPFTIEYLDREKRHLVKAA